MSEDLNNELEAINSIYGDDTLRATENPEIYILSIPNREVSFRLSFPANYPTAPPIIEGTEATGEGTRKGYGAHVSSTARKVLEKIFVPGSVCLFDLVEELDTALAGENVKASALDLQDDNDSNNVVKQHPSPSASQQHPEPQWTLSTPVTEKKSLFLARACPVDSPAQAQACIAHLLSTDKRAANATHNISAYRIRSPAPPSGGSGSATEIIYQDCDDDGETAAGGRLLHLMQLMEVWGLLVVVSRWYGGVKLGPDRFRIVNTVAREVILGMQQGR